MITPSKALRRPLRFKTPEELNAELDQLLSGTYEMAGNWSLPQACQHLAITVEGNLTPPESDEATPEQIAAKNGFFGVVFAPQGMPENMPIGNPALVPPADCADTEIDRLKTAMQSLTSYPHKCVKIGRCGPVPVSEVIMLHLAHAAHHLSFIVPPGSRRRLVYPDYDAAISDVQNLRKGYTQVGHWTLPQVARHLTIAISATGQPSTEPATPEQVQSRPTLDGLFMTGCFPVGVQAPDQFVPPADCSDDDVEPYIAALRHVQNYPHETAKHRRFGPLTPSEYQKLVLLHAAHHFSYLIPTSGN